MLAVVKTPHTDLRLKGFVPRAVLDVLRHEYGPALRIKDDQGDNELISVFETELYQDFKRNMKPGDYVKTYRENANLSQAGLGEKLGVTRSFICDIEHHRREISKNFAKELASFFKVSVARFL